MLNKGTLSEPYKKELRAFYYSRFWNDCLLPALKKKLLDNRQRPFPIKTMEDVASYNEKCGRHQVASDIIKIIETYHQPEGG